MHQYPSWIRRRLRQAVRTIAGATLVLAAGTTAVLCGTLSEVQSFGLNPGKLKMFKYVPDRLQEPAPLVVVLHGCNQSAAGYYDRSGWAKQADENGFALLLPEQQIGPGPIIFNGGRNHLTKCFNFAELRDSQRDSGEALSIKQMVDRIKDEIRIDPKRIFVNGLSAGGGMTAVMLATYPEVFAGGAIIAGLPYRCGTKTATAETDCGVTLPGKPHKSAPDRTPTSWGQLVQRAVPDHRGPWPRVSIWQGTADGTVDPPNARELMEQWTNIHGIDQTPDERDEDASKYTRLLFRDTQGKVLVESYEIFGFGHATPIDPDGQDEPCGSLGDTWIVDGNICSTQRIARFWGLTGEPPAVAITEAAPEGTTVHVRGTANDADGTVTVVTVRLDGRSPQSTIPAQGTTDWTAVFGNLGNDTFYITATDNDGFHTTITGAPVPIGNPPSNTPPTVLITRAKAEQDCILIDGQVDDVDGRVTEVAVKLSTRDFRPATLNQGQYKFEECRLPDGTYTTQVRATDDLGATATADGQDLVVQAVQSVSANWQKHMEDGRLRIYQAPCPSVGFGACDAAFPAIFLEHQFSPFDLFRRATSNDWYLDPAHIP